LSKQDKKLSQDYIGNADHPVEKINWDFIRLAMGSVAKLCIIPMQDYLGLGSEARINMPATLGDNWKWRMKKGEFKKKLSKKVFEITKLYGRL